MVSPLGVVQERVIPVASQGPALGSGPPQQQVRAATTIIVSIIHWLQVQYTLVAVNEDAANGTGNPDAPSALRPYSGTATTSI